MDSSRFITAVDFPKGTAFPDADLWLGRPLSCAEVPRIVPRGRLAVSATLQPGAVCSQILADERVGMVSKESEVALPLTVLCRRSSGLLGIDMARIIVYNA